MSLDFREFIDYNNKRKQQVRDYRYKQMNRHQIEGGSLRGLPEMNGRQVQQQEILVRKWEMNEIYKSILDIIN